MMEKKTYFDVMPRKYFWHLSSQNFQTTSMQNFNHPRGYK